MPADDGALPRPQRGGQHGVEITGQVLQAVGPAGRDAAAAVATVVITLLDNVLRPALIRMGADLPLLLIFVGVIGGLLAFGLVGIFVGPVVLAVGYMLLEAWMDESQPPA